MNMMTRKNDATRSFGIAVVGLSGSERDKGHAGVGKSCLCNRFIRPNADDYNIDHISVLSQTDFSGRVVNNDHFLYWGDVSKTSEEGVDYSFQVIEQTEFIDDASFQPFKGGKMEPYMKRCASTKITSAEKLMYICKNQLGIEKEYEQKVLPDGKLNIDGYVCVFDVSIVPNRVIEKQLEAVTTILLNLQRTKKPIVLVTTKNDDANDAYVREVERLLQRKEFKNTIALIETSAHDNVNVELAFIYLAQTIDKCKVRSKALPYVEAARMRKELIDAATDAFNRLVKVYVTEPRTMWSYASKKLATHKDWPYFVQLFGMDGTQRLFRRHIKKLKDEQLAKRVDHYMEMLPNAFNHLIQNAATLDMDWKDVQHHIKMHAHYSQFFFECNRDDGMTWEDLDPDELNDDRIPFDVLDTSEAEEVYKNHVNGMQQEQKKHEYMKEFKQLLKDTGYVTPGKQLNEVRVLFMGRECFEALSEHDCQQIYNEHQRDIIEQGKHNFQELLLEHADLFYHFKSLSPSVTQDDIKEITDVLQDDLRYKILDRLDQDRRLMLFQHLGFVHYPIREHCPAYPNCMDAFIERILSSKTQRLQWDSSNQCLLRSSDCQPLYLIILGTNGLAEDMAAKIQVQCEDDEFEVAGQVYTLDYRIISGDVTQTYNSFRSGDFNPQGCFCIYSDASTFEYVRESLEKTLLSNLEQEDKLPFQGLPIVLIFMQLSTTDEKEMMKLQEDGQSLADNLQCTFMEICQERTTNQQLITECLRQLVRVISFRNNAAGFRSIYQSDGSCSYAVDIRVIMCLFCGDSYSVENVLASLLTHQGATLSSDRSIMLETFLDDCKRRVEVIVSSFHGANAFRDELIHGFILVYSTKRKASLTTLNAFSMNIPNLPIQILAVTDSGGANAFFSNDLCHMLITEGNATADRLHAHFTTISSGLQQKTAIFTPFLKEVWDKKPEIEQAFHMEEPANLSEENQPLPPPRHESYNLKFPNGNDGDIYDMSGQDERLSSSDHSDKFMHHNMFPYSDLIDKNSTLPDFHVYSPPNTPPEPAPPDHDFGIASARINTSRTALLSTSQTSLEEITSDITGSRESVATHGSDLDEADLNACQTSNDSWLFGNHAFTTGRRHNLPLVKTRPKGDAQTLKQPGKLNMKHFSAIEEMLERMNIINTKNAKGTSMSTFVDAPLATPETINLEFARAKFGADTEYVMSLMQDSCKSTKSRQRREKDRPSGYSDSDSEWSSLERRQRAAEIYAKLSRKSIIYKRAKKKKTVPIPVLPPRVPAFPQIPNANVESTNPLSGSNSDSTELSDHEAAGGFKSRFTKRGSSLKKRGHGQGALPVVLPMPDFDSIQMPSLIDDMTGSQCSQYAYSKRPSVMSRVLSNFPMPDILPQFAVNYPSLVDDLISKQNNLQMKMQECTLESTSHRDDSPLLKTNDKSNRKKEKAKAKDDEKMEKRRLKEEKMRKSADKEKEREKKKQKQAKQKGDGGQVNQAAKLSDIVQSENTMVPLFLEKCVRFIEEEGLDSEGIYRVPGNRAHVDLLFHKFEEDCSLSIRDLDIPVNAVATALKDFFSKRLPPLFDENILMELEDIAGPKAKPLSSSIEVKTDRSCRLLALRAMLNKLSTSSFNILKYLFQHFVRVTENSKLNSMDSKNLAICWWPTLLPIEFSDMGCFEQMRPFLEDIVQTMIDQYPFLFCGKEAFVMV